MFSGKPLDYQDEPLTNNGFWPDLNLKDFQAQRSLPADIDADTISQALLAAVAEVNAELENVEATGYRHPDGRRHSAGQCRGL